jgi:hypothetical protein
VRTNYSEAGQKSSEALRERKIAGKIFSRVHFVRADTLCGKTRSRARTRYIGRFQTFHPLTPVKKLRAPGIFGFLSGHISQRGKEKVAEYFLNEFLSTRTVIASSFKTTSIIDYFFGRVMGREKITTCRFSNNSLSFSFRIRL